MDDEVRRNQYIHLRNQMLVINRKLSHLESAIGRLVSNTKMSMSVDGNVVFNDLFDKIDNDLNSIKNSAQDVVAQISYRI